MMPGEMRFSKKRAAILDAISSTKSHPSAEWVYMKLKPEFPELSLGTVYRNIAAFKNDGTIISVGTVRGEERYDSDTRPHAHFVCTSCGCIEDIQIPLKYDTALDEFVSDECRASAVYHEIKFYGKCSKCVSNAD